MRALLLTGRCRNGLYILPHNRLSQTLISDKISMEEWHRRLGHPASPVVLHVIQDNNLVVDANVFPFLDLSCLSTRERTLVPFYFFTTCIYNTFAIDPH
jgi:hypothetical protein